MIHKILLNDKEKDFLKKYLREKVLDNLEKNCEIIENNKSKNNYLEILNENNKQIIMIKSLLKKLE